MFSLVALLFFPARGWDLWNMDEERCGQCADIPVEKLVQANRGKYHVGCLNNKTYSAVPKCEVASAFTAQAGGHVGDFFLVKGGHVAKLFMTVKDTDPCGPQGDKEACRRQRAGTIEYELYMHLWCLARFREPTNGGASLTQKGRSLQSASHPMDPFVKGTNAWAPKFYGVCQENLDDDQTGLYLVMENLMGDYSKPSQLDLKVGASYEPFAIERDGFVKGHVEANLIDAFTPTRTFKARVAGFKVWNPAGNAYRKMWKKQYSPMMSLTKVMDNLFVRCERHHDLDLLTQTSNQIMDMAIWWQKTGRHEVRSISASILFIYEGDPSATSTPPTVKFIDFAHFFPLSDKPDWPDDGVTLGLFSAARFVDVLRDAAAQKQGVELPTQGASMCATNQECRQKCAGKALEISPVQRSRCSEIGQRFGSATVQWMNRPRLPICKICDSTTELRSYLQLEQK